MAVDGIARSAAGCIGRTSEEESNAALSMNYRLMSPSDARRSAIGRPSGRFRFADQPNNGPRCAAPNGRPNETERVGSGNCSIGCPNESNENGHNESGDVSTERSAQLLAAHAAGARLSV